MAPGRARSGRGRRPTRRAFAARRNVIVAQARPDRLRDRHDVGKIDVLDEVRTASGAGCCIFVRPVWPRISQPGAADCKPRGAGRAPLKIQRSASSGPRRQCGQCRRTRALFLPRPPSGGLDFAGAVGLNGQHRAARRRRHQRARVLTPIPAPAQHMRGVGVDHFAVLRGSSASSPSAAMVDEVSPGLANGNARSPWTASRSSQPRHKPDSIETRCKIDQRRRRAAHRPRARA